MLVLQKSPKVNKSKEQKQPKIENQKVDKSNYIFNDNVIPLTSICTTNMKCNGFEENV